MKYITKTPYIKKHKPKSFDDDMDFYYENTNCESLIVFEEDPVLEEESCILDQYGKPIIKVYDRTKVGFLVFED